MNIMELIGAGLSGYASGGQQQGSSGGFGEFQRYLDEYKKSKNDQAAQQGRVSGSAANAASRMAGPQTMSQAQPTQVIPQPQRAAQPQEQPNAMAAAAAAANASTITPQQIPQQPQVPQQFLGARRMPYNSGTMNNGGRGY